MDRIHVADRSVKRQAKKNWDVKVDRLGLGFRATMMINQVDGDNSKALQENAETEIRLRFERDSIGQNGYFRVSDMIE